MLLALKQWGDRWSWPDGRGPVSVVHGDCGHEVRVEVRCPHCERDVASGELRAKPGAALPRPPAPHEPGHVSERRLYSAGGGVPIEVSHPAGTPPG